VLKPVLAISSMGDPPNFFGMAPTRRAPNGLRCAPCVRCRLQTHVLLLRKLEKCLMRMRRHRDGGNVTAQRTRPPAHEGGDVKRQALEAAGHAIRQAKA
jgi:hypothetical protein